MKFLGVLVLIGLSIAMVRSTTSKSGPTGTAKGQPVATISHGEKVELADHLEEGSWTLFEFTADW